MLVFQIVLKAFQGSGAETTVVSRKAAKRQRRKVKSNSSCGFALLRSLLENIAENNVCAFCYTDSERQKKSRINALTAMTMPTAKATQVARVRN